MKKLNLKKQPFIEIKIRAYQSYESKDGIGGRGITLMGFSDTMTTVSEDGEKVGSVAGCVGGFVLLDKRHQSGRPYIIMHDDFWYAFQEALEKQKKHKGDKNGNRSNNKRTRN